MHTLGNLGQSGIDAFVQQHKCNTICIGLGLDKIQYNAADEERPVTTISVLCQDFDDEDRLAGIWNAWSTNPDGNFSIMKAPGLHDSEDEAE